MNRQRTKVKIRYTFPVYFALLALLESAEACGAALLALFMHELFHLLAGNCIGAHFDRIELTPFGGVMTPKPGEAPRTGLTGAFVAAAGPLGNYATVLVLCTQPAHALLGDAFIRQAMLANAIMMGFNLLPALPLDGGQLAFCLLCGVFGVGRTVHLLTGLGVLLGAGLSALSIFGMARWGVLNLSALIVGGYLMICAAKSRSDMLAGHLYAFVHERCAEPERQIRCMQLFEVSPDARALVLIEAMERCEKAAFLVHTTRGLFSLDEKAACRALLNTPAARVCEIAEANGKKLDTATKNANDS